MPKKAKTAKPEAAAAETKPVEAAAAETKPVEAAPEAPKGSKTAAVKKALKANPTKGPKEISELLQAEGWDIKAQLVSVVKSAMKAKKRKAKAAAAAAPVMPKDAVSVGLLDKAKKWADDLDERVDDVRTFFGLLVKAKKLAAQFSSIKEAQGALAALSQLMD